MCSINHLPVWKVYTKYVKLILYCLRTFWTLQFMLELSIFHCLLQLSVCCCTLQLTLWDTAGIERFTTLSASYFHSTHAAIVCYALDDLESFSYSSQHVLEAVEQTGTAKIFLCGTKKDCEGLRDSVTDTDVQRLTDQLDHVLTKTFKVSNRTGEGVSEMFQCIAQCMNQHVNERFDSSKIKLMVPPPRGGGYISNTHQHDQASHRCCSS